MKHWTLAALVVVCVVVLVSVSCGSKDPCSSSSPVAPSGCVSIRMDTSTSALKIGQTFTFAATAMHKGGTDVAVTQWSSDNTQTATADAASGKVTGLTLGSATIIAEHDGARGTKLTAVVPDFQGTWNGDYAITSCRASEDFQAADFCTDFGVGTIFPIAAVLTQPFAQADGTVYFGQVPATVTATAETSGRLTFSDASIKEDVFTVKVTGMVFTMDGSGRLNGAFTTTWTAGGYSGQGSFDGQLRTVTKVSASTAPLSVRRPLVRTWRDLASMFRAR